MSISFKKSELKLDILTDMQDYDKNKGLSYLQYWVANTLHR